MMKCLYLLLFVAVSQAFVTKDVQDTQRSIPRPSFTHLHSFEDPVLGFTIEWTPVANSNSNPVIGYRLIVLEEIRPNSNQFKNFQDIGLYGADKSIAAVAKLEQGLWYEFRVQAITNNGYGPLSNMWGILVNHWSDGQRKATYSMKKDEEEKTQ